MERRRASDYFFFVLLLMALYYTYYTPAPSSYLIRLLPQVPNSQKLFLFVFSSSSSFYHQKFFPTAVNWMRSKSGAHLIYTKPDSYDHVLKLFQKSCWATYLYNFPSSERLVYTTVRHEFFYGPYVQAVKKLYQLLRVGFLLFCSSI